MADPRKDPIVELLDDGPDAPDESPELTNTIPPVPLTDGQADLAARYDFQYTALGNAEHLLVRHGQNIRYVAPEKTWLHWNGSYWIRDAQGKLIQLAKDTIKSFYRFLPEIEDKERKMKLFKWILSSERNGMLEEMLKLAGFDPKVVLMPDQLDSHSNLLCAANGVIDLETGLLLPATREQLLTRHSPIIYDPDATSPEWKAFLGDVTGKDPELERFLQLAAGYSLTGETREEIIFVAHGPGGTGKSTFIEAIGRAAGDYHVTANFATFLKRDRISGGPSEDLARLVGARFVASIEVDEGQKLAEALVKQMTGGDIVAARFLYQGTFEYKPQMTLWLVCNHVPAVTSDDDSIWRRLLRVPFIHKPAKVNKNLKRILTDRKRVSPAVLAWAVAGAMTWYRDGLRVPDVVLASTAELREDMDPLTEFLSECCALSPEKYVHVVDLRTAYEVWSKANGQRFLLGKQKFDRLLEAHGLRRDHRRIKDKKLYCWLGIEIIVDLADVFKRTKADDDGIIPSSQPLATYPKQHKVNRFADLKV